MKEITDYDKVFETLVQKTQDYLVNNNIKAMILGISGGIDSTVVAAICHEVSERTEIPLIGRSLPTKFNKEEEVTTAQLVGKAFCTNYKEVSIEKTYKALSEDLYGYECTLGFEEPQPTALTNGNIQARLRMMYLYNLAGMYKGLVMDTDNLTENNLGYFTIHGDVGDFNPIGGLWKTEVFKLAQYLINFYRMTDQIDKGIAMFNSWSLKPTAGLGITNNDLEEIGAESYDQVDTILKEILKLKDLNYKQTYIKEEIIETLSVGSQMIENVFDRHFKSEFKRKQLPIKITRDDILL
jgi:NAD+ synthetase